MALTLYRDVNWYLDLWKSILYRESLYLHRKNVQRFQIHRPKLPILPPEMYDHIASFLDVPDLHSFAASCKMFSVTVKHRIPPILPPEIYDHIASFLGKKDLEAWKLTCKFMNKIANKHLSTYFRIIHITNFSAYNILQFYNGIAALGYCN